MKQVRFSYLFYALPLVFFVLSGSPNLTGPRIGLTLAIIAILFIVVSYLLYRTKRKHPQQIKLADIIFVGIVIGCMIVGKAVNYEFILLMTVWLLLRWVSTFWFKYRVIRRLIEGLLLFCIIYFGINQYDFTNLLNGRILWTALVFLFQYFLISSQFKQSVEVPLNKWINEMIWGYFLALISLALFSWLMFDLSYLFYLVLITAPASYLIYKLSRSADGEPQVVLLRWFSILATSGLIVYNTYLFLNSTQVLQAVMGGY